jgi:hypothetical protein
MVSHIVAAERRPVARTHNALHSRQAERIIPLHLALIKIGFLKFVATMKSGPHFALPSPDASAERAGA